MMKVYPNSLRHYKNYREGRGKKPGKEFSTLSVKGAHRSDRLSLEAEEFDRKIKELGGKKKVDPIAKTIVWTLPRFNTERTA